MSYCLYLLKFGKLSHNGDYHNFIAEFNSKVLKQYINYADESLDKASVKINLDKTFEPRIASLKSQFNGKRHRRLKTESVKYSKE